MKNNYLGEIIISTLLIGLLIFFVNPFDLLMPHMLHPFMAPFLVVLLVILLGFLWKEHSGDEREILHRYISSRFAYFSSVLILIVGIVYESFHGNIDPWLVISVCLILLAKLLGLIFARIKH